jgi:hypothetical protein
MGNRTWLVVFLLLGSFTGGRAAPVPVSDGDEYKPLLKRVVALLPRKPGMVQVIDADEAEPEVRQNLLKLDAFILVGRPGIYLTKQSEVLQGALKGSRLLEHVLATIIWHEMAHLDGGDERAARKAEQDLWTTFVRDGVCDHLTALRYLRALANRPEDRPVAAGSDLRAPKRDDVIP